MEDFPYEKPNHLGNWVDSISEFSFVTWMDWNNRIALFDRKGWEFHLKQNRKRKERRMHHYGN